MSARIQLVIRIGDFGTGPPSPAALSFLESIDHSTRIDAASLARRLRARVGQGEVARTCKNVFAS